MTTIAAWPVVVRDRIVHAFKPGAPPSAEAPFRTLRRHKWVSQGVRVTLFADRGLAGQLTLFSSLNVMAARLARRGDSPAAERAARAAADLESGPEFAVLRSLLSELPGQQEEGTATMVPLWMADAAQRDQVGDFLALVADKLEGASAVVEAVPAIDIDDGPGADGFSPFGHRDARTRSITPDDVRLLTGDPQALRILVPVTIDG